MNETAKSICGAYAPILVLVIEQRRAELDSIRAALGTAKVVNRLKYCDTSPACVDFLARSDPPPPDLVIIDLGVIEKANGDLLRQLRSEKLKDVPVVALGGREGDEALAADLHADFYVEKPLTPAHVVGIVQACDTLDLAIVKTLTQPKPVELTP